MSSSSWNPHPTEPTSHSRKSPNKLPTLLSLSKIWHCSSKIDSNPIPTTWHRTPNSKDSPKLSWLSSINQSIPPSAKRKIKYISSSMTSINALSNCFQPPTSPSPTKRSSALLLRIWSRKWASRKNDFLNIWITWPPKTWRFLQVYSSTWTSFWNATPSQTTKKPW